MSDLNFAHRGYVYQDLLAAVEAVDVILGRVERLWCDTRLCGEYDRFDDLTVDWADGRRERRQIKHQVEPRPLDVDTFARPDRSLLLSEILRGVSADMAANPESAATTSYTIYLRDSNPTDAVLTSVLVLAEPDPGPSVVGTSTTRYRFDPDALWAGVHRPGAGRRPAGDAWEFLRAPAAVTGTNAGRRTFTHDEIARLCERLIVEVNAPAMSSNFAEPGPLEELLLGRLRTEVGVGEYPNENRLPEDVAALLVAAAAKGRATHEPLTRGQLLRALSLRTDYGSVSRRSPAVAEQQVGRDAAVAALHDAIDAASQVGGYVIAQAPPGQGKSWVADQLRSSLLSDAWTVAEHYCYLNDSEDERDDRVATERIFGSLMERVASTHPDLAAEQRPIFSADEQTLMRLVSDVVSQAGNSVALMVDGLDHVTRVRGIKPGTLSASHSLAAQIAALEPPPGCAVVVFSQPGEHLAPLIGEGAVTVPIPPMDLDEIGELVGRLGVFGVAESAADGVTEPLGTRDGTATVDESPEGVHVAQEVGETGGALGGVVPVLAHLAEPERLALAEAVFQRSGGNPLYATYLVRELIRPDRAVLDMTSGSPAEVLATIPPYDGDLEHYYAHLAALLDEVGQAAADTLTLVDFPLTEDELKTIQPGQGHRITKALRVLQPVLRSSPGGFTVYHESFARFLRRELDAEHEALASRIDAVVAWLSSLGLFDDGRAFGSMLPLLAAGGRHTDVLAIVDRSFAAQAVGAGFPPSAIRASLAVAVRCAQRTGDWPAVVRSLELMRGVETYEQERLADLDTRFLDVRLALFGGQKVVDRMLRNGLITMPPEAGLLLCAELDRAGVAPPWREYLQAWMERGDGEHHREDDGVDAAVLRGQMRLLSTEGIAVSAASRERRQTGERSDVAHLLAQARAWCDAHPSPDRCRIVVETVSEILTVDTAAAMADDVQAKGTFLLAIAEQLEALSDDIDVTPHGSASGWATQALVEGLPRGGLHRARELGAEIRPASAGGANAGEVDTESTAAAKADAQVQAVLAAAEAALNQHSPQNCTVFLDAVERCRTQPVALNAVIEMLDGEGWYPCWLRFCVDLVRAEACAPDETSSQAMVALARLAEDTRPFTGKPRAVDLYQEMGLIWSTVARAVRLLDTDDWTGGIELLLEVGRSVTGSMDGEMGVPLPPDRTLTLALETAPSEHLTFLSELIRSEIERSAGRFYSDIAEFHLLDALVQLRRADLAAERPNAGERGLEAQDARHEAMRAWSAACNSLLAYGWHKDITVFEVLDPLESLTALDPARGLERMVDAFDLAYRAWRHSDGRETRHAPLQWWAMLAKADPIAHAEKSLEHGLASRGERTRWEEMRQDLWTAHALSADPVLALLASGTLPEAPRTNIYEAVLRRFAADRSEPHNQALRDAILRRALTRGDEVARSSRDGDSTAYEAVAASLSAMAAERGLRRLDVRIEAEVQDSASDGTFDPGGSPGPGSTAITATLEREYEEAGATALEEVNSLAESAPAGAVGVAALTRAWRRSGANAGRGATRSKVVDAYAGAIGSRLEGMLDEVLSAEVTAALEALSEVFSFSDQHLLLARIGNGLADALEVSGPAPVADGGEQEDPPASHLMRETAARALALAWAQARGNGGWLAFGGSEHVGLLHRATALAPEVASEAVGSAVERCLDGRQTMGVTRALIEALSVGALHVPALPDRLEKTGDREEPSEDATPSWREPVDAAFAVWDEAFAVISGRVPPTSGEEPGEYYGGVRHEPPVAEPAISNPDYALVLATFAGLTHPGREHLRRTMIALEDLAALRPALFARGLPRVLASMTGAVVPVQLLTMLDRVGARDSSLLAHSIHELKGLLSSDYLAVRAMARRLLARITGEELPGPASDTAGFPHVDLGPGDVDRRWSEAVEVWRRAPFRALVMEERVHGFLPAVVELIAREMDDEDFTREWHKAASEMGNHEWPDAVLLDQHVAEEALQRAAGAIRAHLALHGLLVSGAIEWEDHLAEAMAPTPVPVMFERGRIPRPALPMPPVRSELTAPREASVAAQPGDAGLDEPTPWPALASDAGEPYADWPVLAYCELRRASPSRNFTDRDERSYIEAGVEVDLALVAQSEWGEPLGAATLGQWMSPERQTEGTRGRIRLAATARPVGPALDDRARLGLPQMLAPSAELIEALDLSGVTFDEAEVVMSDPTGPAVAHVVWRASYRHSDYFMSYPQLEGAALLLRPDLAQRLRDRWGDRLTWRSWSQIQDDQDDDVDTDAPAGGGDPHQTLEPDTSD